MRILGRPAELPTVDQALPGRDEPVQISGRHAVTGERITPPFREGTQTAEFALGCFWGAERLFWQTPGVLATAAGYAGGYTPNPTYEEVCSGRTGHTETVLVIFDPDQVSYEDLLRVFWETHDPTQGHRQGNDVGTQYRSAVFYADDAQREAAERTRASFGRRLAEAGYGAITTDIAPARAFYYAEDYHQQYLHKVPNGYCPVHSTGVSCG